MSQGLKQMKHTKGSRCCSSRRNILWKSVGWSEYFLRKWVKPWVHRFLKNLGAISEFLRRPISDMKQIPYRGRTNIGPPLYKIYSPGKIGKGMQSNTTMSIKALLMATLDNYMFRPLLVIFRLSSRELNVYNRTFSSLEDNLKMASKGRNK